MELGTEASTSMPPMVSQLCCLTQNQSPVGGEPHSRRLSTVKAYSTQVGTKLLL
jgi:hypothetical protein